MAVMFPTWIFFTTVIVLAPQVCTGENSCSIMSTAGSVVELGSSFKVYCTFKCPCKCVGSMCSDHPPTQQGHEVFNSTTVYFNVANITRNKTYSCQCDCPQAPDSCGMDIFTGYAPAVPSNISCIYKVQTNDSRTVLCTWNRGSDTFLTSGSSLWVRTLSGEHTSGPVTYGISRKGPDFLSAGLAMSGSVQRISVWVESRNILGSAESVLVNYTLSDIAMPSAPELAPPTCSSQECVLPVKQSVRVDNLEIQYRAEADAWTSLPRLGVQANLTLDRSISALRPYRLYHFRARAKFSIGLWSQWSADVSSWTEEEAPVRKPDVWHAVVDVKSLRVYWKEEDLSAARGKITQYRISVHSQNSGPIFNVNVSADVRNYTVPFGAGCDVWVQSCTSKGCSPLANINPRYTKAKPLRIAASGAAISWRNDVTAGQQAGYVVEWYPEGHKLEELQWIRLGSNDSRALLTGAVYVVHINNTVSGTGFTGITTSESAPAAVPSVLEKVEGNSVKVTWMQIPRGQRGGCITGYTIYLESGSRDRQVFSVAASENTYVIEDLPPATYTLWMSASTPVGEGPIGPRSKVKFFVQQASSIMLPLVAMFISMMVVLLMCLCQSSVVQQRVRLFLKCLLPNKVPDPANSKWAKECVLQTGKMKLQLQSSISSTTAEDDSILVEVEELPQQSRGIGASGASSQAPSPTHPSPTSKPGVLLYPTTTYIKSFSHDSDSSVRTSLGMNLTVDYISAHKPEQEIDEEEEFAEMISFFPSHNFVIDPLEFGGKLTLDAVKVNCGDLFMKNI